MVAWVLVASHWRLLMLASAAALMAPSAPAAGSLSTKPIAPQFNRLNPISGLANLFSKQQMANVAKMVLMTAILAWVAWKFIGNSIEAVAMLVLQPSPLAMGQLADWLTSGMSLLLLVVFLAALVDVPMQAFFFKDRLKMSHEEVKQRTQGIRRRPAHQGPHPPEAARDCRPRQRGRRSQGRLGGHEPHPLRGGAQVRRQDHERAPA